MCSFSFDLIIMQFSLDRVRKIYEKFPRPSVPQNLDLADDDDDDMQKLSEAIAAAKTRVECCSSFLKASIKLDTLSLVLPQIPPCFFYLYNSLKTYHFSCLDSVAVEHLTMSIILA